MPKKLHTIILLLCLVAAACSKSEDFTVKGKIADGATMNVRAIYYEDGKMQNSVFPADKGAFAFKGHSPEGAVIELLANDYRLLGRFYAADGDEIELTLYPKSPSKIQFKGNEIGERWAKVLNDNAALLDSKNTAGINAFVAKYVSAHRDDIVSTLLLMTSYDWSSNPAEGERLLASIAAEARPARLVDGCTVNLARVGKQAVEARVVPFSYIDERDSLANFNPRRQEMALLAFSNENSGRADSIVPALKRIHNARANEKKLRVLDFSLDSDTLTWRRLIRPDSAKYDHGWVAGSVAAPAVRRLGIPRLPFFVVIDSAGTQLYRGGSIKAAEALLKKKGLKTE